MRLHNAHDGLNRRVSKATGGHTDDSYFNEQWQVLEVRRDGDADAREQYVWEETYIDTPAVRFFDGNTDGDLADAGDNTLYYLTDANHNVTAVFDAGTQQIAERYVYDPYGKATIYNPTWAVTRATSSVGNNILFAGYYFDWETQNFYARNRYYQPALGRWVSRDPEGYIDGMSRQESFPSRLPGTPGRLPHTMPRPRRAAVGGLCYHVLNRAVARHALFAGAVGGGQWAVGGRR